MAKAMAKPSWKWKMRKKMSEREREGLICHFIIFTASFAAEQENIASEIGLARQTVRLPQTGRLSDSHTARMPDWPVC